MRKSIVEIKARCSDHAALRSILNEYHAEFRGRDRQIDTYFDVPDGRLKLREGSIENALIYYQRTDQPEPKESQVLLHETVHGDSLKAILSKLHPVLVVVEKEREIYFAGNVKIHLDEVRELGAFVEIEAIDGEGTRTLEELRSQCLEFMRLFRIGERDLLTGSYSDMLLCVRSLPQEARLP